MSSFLYPDSVTRKMYGQAGKRLALQQRRMRSILNQQEIDKQKQINALKNELEFQKNLSWYKKLWILILELFKNK